MTPQHWAVTLQLYLLPADAGEPEARYTYCYAGVVRYETPRDIAIGCARHLLGPDASAAEVVRLAVRTCGASIMAAVTCGREAAATTVRPRRRSFGLGAYARVVAAYVESASAARR